MKKLLVVLLFLIWVQLFSIQVQAEPLLYIYGKVDCLGTCGQVTGFSIKLRYGDLTKEISVNPNGSWSIMVKRFVNNYELELVPASGCECAGASIPGQFQGKLLSSCVSKFTAPPEVGVAGPMILFTRCLVAPPTNTLTVPVPIRTPILGPTPGSFRLMVYIHDEHERVPDDGSASVSAVAQVVDEQSWAISEYTEDGQVAFTVPRLSEIHDLWYTVRVVPGWSFHDQWECVGWNANVDLSALEGCAARFRLPNVDPVIVTIYFRSLVTPTATMTTMPSRTPTAIRTPTPTKTPWEDGVIMDCMVRILVLDDGSLRFLDWNCVEPK